MTNAEAARAFDELADLLEIKGEDSFRVNTYRRVARTLGDLAVELTDVAARGELAALPGIGKASAEKIEELLRTGKLALRDEITREVPATLLELLQVQGLGPKKAALLWRERGVTSLAQLKQCIESGGLADLRGFGKKSIDSIRQGISFVESSAGRSRLGWAWGVAQRVAEALRGIPGVTRVEPAGSLRRGCETVGDLDLLCIADDGAAVVDAFTRIAGVEAVLAHGPTKGSIRLTPEAGRSIQVDLRVVPAESFGAAWQYFTGSKQHNVRLRERAVKRGWTLNEYGLSESDGGRVIASRTEEEIYKALRLPWVPPELREDRGELELTEAPTDLLTLEMIRGDLHMHTTASDGKATIAEMAQRAIARGYQYIAITDHSQSSAVAGGLKPDRLLEHIADVRRVARDFPQLTLLAGAEVDILSDRLDYPDELLAQLDWVVASIHFGMGHDIEANTRRALMAIENPYVNVLAHPTGRLINKREAMPLDIDAISRAAARTGTALEINASAYRLDLRDVHARLARDNGATLCIDTDAHAVEQLDQMRFGVLTARRGWLRRQDVLNTRTIDEVRAFVAAKRAAAGGR
ncbi:MAG: DNA polymerase/3'-5' exonuclease PolX [Phycisphaerales bacterium]|nr:DNA polymerase/3'-5' exonuclease PolX [Phycisphaerales bacterium]